MSRYAYKTVDRRLDYYHRAAPVIAVDSLDFYARAERGRVFQMNLFPRASDYTPGSDYERDLDEGFDLKYGSLRVAG